jgi:tetratricopeptide (TPR) repeat protein
LATPSSGDDRFIAALRLGFDGQEQRAIDDLRALLKEDNSDEDKGWILIYEARFLGHLLRVAEAKERLETVSKIWPGTPGHQARLAIGKAVLYEAEGDAARCLKELDQIFKAFAGQWSLPELQEPYEEIQANRGRLLVGQDRWKEALPLLEETARSEKGKPGEFYLNLGYCYFMAGKWKEAEQRLNQALTNALHPILASGTHYYLGRLAYRRQAFALAIKEYELAAKYAIETGKPVFQIYREISVSYKQLGMTSESDRYSQLAHSSADGGKD